MNSFRFLSLLSAVALSFPGSSAAIDALAVNTSVIASLADTPPSEQQTEANPAVVHLQVLTW